MKKKIKHIRYWLDDRGGFSELVKPFTTHLMPPGAKWNYVWGSATLFCLIIQIITGISLAFMYQPSSEVAYQSLQYIENQAFLGSFIRGLHSWGASGMILLMGIHMIRVYINAAYKYPREMSWISGVLLMVITILMAFTGQLLRWDNNGVWSAIVAAEQMGRIPFIGSSVSHFLLGGTTVGGITLSRFFTLHTFVFPALIMSVVAYHLFLVFKNGISEPPKVRRLIDSKTYRAWYKKMLQKEGVPFFPNAVWRDAVFSLFVFIIIIVLAWLIGAPALSGPPSMVNIDVNPRPDWYFEWIFAIYALMPHQIESYIMFIGPLIGGALLFSIPFLSNKEKRSPLRRRWAAAGVIFIVLSIGGLSYMGFLAPWSPRFNTKLLPLNTVIANSSKGAKEGIKLFNTAGCIYCHTIDGRGGIKGPNLTNVQNRLTHLQITNEITNGFNDMPGFKRSLTTSEIDLISSFLSMKGKSNMTGKK